MLETYQQSDLDKLAELHESTDARSIEEMIADDQYEEYVLDTAKAIGDDQYEVGFDGWHTILSMPAGKKVKAGDTVRFYQPGAFAARHGFAVNGQVIEWKTPWERYAERIAMLAQHDRDRRERIVKDRPVLDGWYAQLQGPFKARIDRFRAEREDFDVQSGMYEMYPVLMAQRIFEWAHDKDDQEAAIRRFHDLSYDEQKPVIHAGEEDRYGISGHQFDSACGLALAVAQGKDV